LPLADEIQYGAENREAVEDYYDRWHLRRTEAKRIAKARENSEKVTAKGYQPTKQQEKEEYIAKLRRRRQNMSVAYGREELWIGKPKKGKNIAPMNGPSVGPPMAAVSSEIYDKIKENYRTPAPYNAAEVELLRGYYRGEVSHAELMQKLKPAEQQHQPMTLPPGIRIDRAHERVPAPATVPAISRELLDS
jgi:hypothetical protein